jgi:hypothetical protein
MDRNAVDAMSQVAQILVTIKGMVSECDQKTYRMVKEQLGDCHEIMARYCDTSPLKLMSGQVEQIMENFAVSE